MLFLCRGVEQLAARRAHNPKVVGSSPTPATKQKDNKANHLAVIGLILLSFQNSLCHVCDSSVPCL
jgi:hypothetical protein